MFSFPIYYPDSRVNCRGFKGCEARLGDTHGLVAHSRCRSCLLHCVCFVNRRRHPWEGYYESVRPWSCPIVVLALHKPCVRNELYASVLKTLLEFYFQNVLIIWFHTRIVLQSWLMFFSIWTWNDSLAEVKYSTRTVQKTIPHTLSNSCYDYHEEVKMILEKAIFGKSKLNIFGSKSHHYNHSIIV